MRTNAPENGRAPIPLNTLNWALACSIRLKLETSTYGLVGKHLWSLERVVIEVLPTNESFFRISSVTVMT